MSTDVTAHQPMKFGARASLLKTTQASALLDAMTPRTADQALKMAEQFAKSGLVPRAYQGKPQDIIVAGMWGAQLGLNWLQSLKAIAVINGNPGIWGDVGYALMHSSGQLEVFQQEWDAVKRVAVCTIKRRGQEARTATFSWEQAVTARLDKKDTYMLWPDVMCGWRAFWRAARPTFADIFMGMMGAEEAFDMSRQEVIQAPVPEPRAIEDRSMGDALKAYGANPAKSQAPSAQAQRSNEQSAQGAAPAADYSQPTMVQAVEEKTYKVPRGKPDAGATKCYWIIALGDGRKASTYSESFKATAQQALDESIPVTVDSFVNDKGYTNLKDIIFTPPTSDASPDGEEPQDA